MNKALAVGLQKYIRAMIDSLSSLIDRSGGEKGETANEKTLPPSFPINYKIEPPPKKAGKSDLLSRHTSS
ncbi:hypothetical protein L1987_39587 [Smallanthus sonchifolius]|uniref:Uncharacterized protein n=1 Tax=Smallanthus sonchifolius TaxID=185202 RepID=A0ACB9HNS4_9ASTR|nr:hypothetical protein L1987_39587 [Smallanthus sonchifolius]